jgi:hypothetical protein
MSSETYRTLEEAINNHVLDELEGDAQMVRDWAIVIATSDITAVDDLQEITLHRSPGTSLYAVIGLLELAKNMYGAVERE